MIKFVVVRMKKYSPKPLVVVKKCLVCGLDKEIRLVARFCPECKKVTQAINRIKRLEYTRKYRLTPEYRKKRNAQVRAKLASNPKLLLVKRIRNRIYLFIKLSGKVKLQTTEQILGCDYDHLKVHIEGLFKSGMTWQNMGEWHIDHKRPLASAKNEADVLKLNHFTNLQPMWKLDNLKKGTRYNGIVY